MVPAVSLRTKFSATTTSLGWVTAKYGSAVTIRPKRLQVGGGEQLGMIALEDDFPEILGAAFGRDAPKHIGHVFRAVLRGRRHMVEARFDLGGAHLAFDLGLAARGRHQFGAAEIDVGGAGAMVVIDGFGGSRDDRHAENRHRLARSRWASARAAVVWDWGPAAALSAPSSRRNTPGVFIVRKFSFGSVRVHALAPVCGASPREYIPLNNTAATWCPEALESMVLIAVIRFRGVYSKFVCRALSPARFDSGSGFTRAGRVGVSERFSRSAHSKEWVFYFWRRFTMIISMRPHATREEIDHVCERIREFGYKVHSIEGEERVVIGVVGSGRRDRLPGIARSHARRGERGAHLARRTSSSAGIQEGALGHQRATASRSAATSSS